MTRERHKVADLKIKPVECATPIITSLAPPLREVEERAKTNTNTDPKPRQNEKPPVTWRTKMIEARARRKRNTKLQKLASQKESGSFRMQLLEKALLSLEESMAERQKPHHPTETSWYAPTLPQPPAWAPEQSKSSNPTCDLVNNITEAELKQMVLKGTVETGIADSGATSSCGKVLSECRSFGLKTTSLISTGLPSTKIFKYAAGNLGMANEIKHLPFQVRGKAKEVHMTPGLENHLISTNKFVEEDYVQVFDKEEVNIYDANDVKITTTRGAVLRGWRVPKEGLWRIPLIEGACRSSNQNTDTAAISFSPQQILLDLPPPTQDIVSNVYEIKTKPELVRYYHAAAGFPTKPSWLAAIRNNHYRSWHGLDATIASKYFPESHETWNGHGRKVKSGLRSTKALIKKEEDEVKGIKLEKEQAVYVKEFNLKDEADRMMFSDQTGRFPVTSFKGNQYVMVLFETIGNNILVESMRNRTSGEMVRAYQVLMGRMKEKGILPTMHVLDNECSAEFKDAIAENKMKYQLVPPNDHRRNVAEKAIQTFKDHFVSVLCGTDDNFPLQLWCQLLRQAEHQLNMLRKSRTVPSMSSFEHMYGAHSYDAHPWAVLGCEVEIHVMPAKRRTWAAHTKKGYYLGTSWEHYRCHVVWVKETKSTRVGQTVFFKHKYLTQPGMTDTDALIQAADNLKGALLEAKPESNAMKLAVNALMKIFKTKSETEQSPIDQRRNLRANAQRQRIATEQQEEQTQRVGQSAQNDSAQRVPNDPTPDGAQRVPPDEVAEDSAVLMPGLEVTYPSLKEKELRPPVVSQDCEGPSQNTRAARRQRLLSAVEANGSCPSASQAAKRKFPLHFLVDLAAAVLDEETGELLEYRHLIKKPKVREQWGYSFGNEIGRLAQGMPGRNIGTNTIFFINKSKIPDERWKDITSGRIVCNVRPQKEEVFRTRLTVDGSRINIDMDCGTPTASLLTVKMLLNSVISTRGAKFMTLDIKDFYLNTPMERPEYMRMKLANFPEDVIKHYNLRDKADAKGTLYIEIRKGMYGLPHAGIIAQKLLEERLNKAGYYQSEKTPGFWKHEWRPVAFSLIVDDFGIKYVGDQHAKHLIKVLEDHYTVTQDWKAELYSGITLDWDYHQRQVHLSMPGYCKEGLARFKHKLRKLNHQPHRHIVPRYGAKVQYASKDDTSPEVDEESKKFIQQVTGTFLFYARSVDPTMLVALSAIASDQAAPTERTLEKTLYFLDYVATHPDAIITFKKSSMILAIHSDASYLSEPKARSRAGGHFYMSDDSDEQPKGGPVHNVAQIIKNVMTSAADAEIGALYINSRQAIPARQLLEEMGHKQPPTPIQTDNTTALGFVTKNLQPKATKSTEMNCWFMRDRQDRKQFKYYWRPGAGNQGDYFTKHFCPATHIERRPSFLTPRKILDTLRAALGKEPHVYLANERVC